MSKEQPRKPAGTPAGGQWAPMAHAELEVDLGRGLRRLVRESGTVEWRRGTKLHRDDGPAVERPDGSKEWYQHGELHRIGGPAVEHQDGSKEWYQHGKWHRDDGPAVERANGTKEWYQHGRLHRDGGPAVEWPNGVKAWCKHGLLHRTDGPAFEHSNGTYEWWVNGEPVSTPPALDAIATDPDVLSKVSALSSPAKAQLERDVALTKASGLSAEDVELYERGERLPMASVLEVARGTTESVEASETKLNETLRRPSSHKLLSPSQDPA